MLHYILHVLLTMGLFIGESTNGMYLWCSHEVHLEEACLKRALAGTVVLEGIQEEGGTLLDHVHLHEHIHNLYSKRR